MTIENLSNVVTGFVCLVLFETFILIYLIFVIYALKNHLEKEGFIE